MERTEDGRRRTKDGGLMTERISSFRDLRVYQLAFELQQELFEIRRHFRRKDVTLLWSVT